MKTSHIRLRYLLLPLIGISFFFSSVSAINLSDLAGLNDSAKILPFSTTRNYISNETVFHNGKLYRAKVTVTASAFDITKWEVLTTFRGEYAANQSYQIGDVIWGTNNKIYRVLAVLASGTTAITDAAVQAKLQVIGSSGGSIAYDGTKSYAVGDIIVRGGEFLTNKTATTGTVSVPETFSAAKWENWRVNKHVVVSEVADLLSLVVGIGTGKIKINDTVYVSKNEKLYRYTATDGTNDNISDWTVIYDLNRKLDQAEFESRFGAKTYSGSSTYKTNELVTEGGILYRAKNNVGVVDTNGAVTTAAGAFDATDFDVLVNITALIPIDSIDMATNPAIPAPSAANKRHYYIVTVGSTGTVSYANLPTNTKYSVGDMIINLNGSAWSHVKNTTNFASKVESEVDINLLKNDGTEITINSITNTKVLTPLRALQQLLHNRLASFFRLRDNTDETKQLSFNLSKITTGKTRTITVPDEDIVVVGENRIGVRQYLDTEKYLLNQTVLNSGVIWRNTTAITAGEAFNRTKWGFIANVNSWDVKNANVTANSFDRYLLNATAAFNITLPPAPLKGDTVEIKHVSGDIATKNTTVLRNGKRISGLEQNLIIDVANSSIQLTYTGAGWSLEFDTPDTNN